MDTPDNIQEDAVAVAMARGIRDISKALTSHAYGETKEIILVKLDDAKRHIDKASNLVAQKEATETHEPPIVSPEDLTAASRLADGNPITGGRSTVSLTWVAAGAGVPPAGVAGHELPDDAPEQDDNPQNGIEVEEEEPDNEEEKREGDDEPDEEEDEFPDDTGDLDAEMREEDFQGLTLVAASKLIYQAAKSINHDLDNEIPVDPDEFPNVNYGLAAWLRTQEQTAEGATERKAARHLRHIARFIAKCTRRGEFHHVRRVRKYRG